MLRVRDRRFVPALLVGASLLVLVLAPACDEPKSSPPPSSDPPPVAPDEPAPTGVESAPESAPEPEPEPVGGPHCDQREVAGDGGEPRNMCVDYTEHRGATEPRCFDGAELGEGPCPSEAAIGRCVLEATGVTLIYYEGKSLDAARSDCATIDGRFEPV